MRTATIVVVVLLAATVAMGSVRAYAIDPVKAAWSGKAHPTLGVSEVLTVCFDSLEYVELFAGEKGAGGQYTATVLPAEGGNAVATSEPVSQGQNHSWVKFDEWTLTGSFTKGKQYEFRFTRAGADSIGYFTAPGTSYRYGFLKKGGTEEARRV